MLENDELHRLWVHVPDVGEASFGPTQNDAHRLFQLSDFSLEIDISGARVFRRSEIATRIEPYLDLTKLPDILRRGLVLENSESGIFTALAQSRYGSDENPNLYAVHFDISGLLLVAWRRARKSGCLSRRLLAVFFYF